MAKKAYFGAANVARKAKKQYFGVGGVARKVKKAYFGVDDVARQCFSGGEVSYYGTPMPLSNSPKINNFASASLKNYALFGGGYANGAVVDTVDAYDASLTRISAPALTVARRSLSAATVGNYVLFAGGVAIANSGAAARNSNIVDAYDGSLTRTTPRALGDARYSPSAGSTGGHALFAGGMEYKYGYDYDAMPSVDAYDISLTQTYPDSLNVSRGGVAAARAGTYLLFAGGWYDDDDYNYWNEVIAYDESLTRTLPAKLKYRRSGAAGASVGNYALFAGGSGESDEREVVAVSVESYNSSLTRGAAASLSVSGSYGGISFGEYAMFGDRGIELYDESLTKKANTLSKAYRGNMTAKVGDFALFAHTEGIDAYTLG